MTTCWRCRKSFAAANGSIRYCDHCRKIRGHKYSGQFSGGGDGLVSEAARKEKVRDTRARDKARIEANAIRET